MPPTPPREVLLSYFNSSDGDCKLTDANLTDEDGVQVTHQGHFSMSEQNLVDIFHSVGLGLIFIVDERGVPRPIPTGGPPVAYVHELYVQPVVIDRWASATERSLKATKLMDKAMQEVRRVVRTNMVGSMRVTGQEAVKVERLGTQLLFAPELTVFYTQYATQYETPTNAIATRRFFNFTKELRIGVSSGTYSAIGPGSGVEAHWEEVDPWVKIPIPGASNAVYQVIGNPDVEGWVSVRDYGSLYTLLYSTNIDGSANKAVTATTRNVIGYFAIVDYGTVITTSTDVRTGPQSSYVFANARIRNIIKPHTSIANPWTFHFYADSVTETHA
jgi:hypothetical protein